MFLARLPQSVIRLNCTVKICLLQVMLSDVDFLATHKIVPTIVRDPIRLRFVWLTHQRTHPTQVTDSASMREWMLLLFSIL